MASVAMKCLTDFQMAGLLPGAQIVLTTHAAIGSILIWVAFAIIWGHGDI